MGCIKYPKLEVCGIGFFHHIQQTYQGKTSWRSELKISGGSCLSEKVLQRGRSDVQVPWCLKNKPENLENVKEWPNCWLMLHINTHAWSNMLNSKIISIISKRI